MLANKRLDAIYEQRNVAGKLYIAISKKSPIRKYLIEVNKKLKQLKEAGVVGQLTKK